MAKVSHVQNLPQFQTVADTTIVMDVLMARLPKSANIYNMALSHSKFQKDMNFYFLDPRKQDSENPDRTKSPSKVGEDSWIIAVYHRKDYGQEVAVSAPKDPFRRITPTTLQNVLLTSSVINWKQSYFIIALELSISQVFFELSCRINENITQVFPDYFYFMDIDDVEDIEAEELLKQIKTKKELKSAEVKGIHSLTGIEFLTKNWKYAKEGTYMHVGKVVKNNPSVGVIVDDEIVSGVVLDANGFVDMLATLPEFRRKKLGTLAMKSLIIAAGKSGFVPCSAVHKSNATSNAMHKALGFKVNHAVETIAYDAGSN